MMIERVTLLVARRSYEFRPDDLRLSTLSTPPIMDRIRQAFSFQQVGIGAPMLTFGPAPATAPPGLAFDLGFWSTSGQQPILIRFLHFEARRIVIDVAAPSVNIDAIFNLLRTVVAEMSAPDGAPLIGEPERVLDYSEITAQLSAPVETIFQRGVRDAIHWATGVDRSGDKLTIAPTLYVQIQPVDQEYPGATVPPNSQTLQLAIRAGTSPKDNICFSGAPLDSETHLIYLARLAEVLEESG